MTELVALLKVDIAVLASPEHITHAVSCVVMMCVHLALPTIARCRATASIVMITEAMTLTLILPAVNSKPAVIAHTSPLCVHKGVIDTHKAVSVIRSNASIHLITLVRAAATVHIAQLSRPVRVTPTGWSRGIVYALNAVV
jgi:hypothetical protein